MKHAYILSIFICIIFFVTTSAGDKTKVEVTYSQKDVTVVLNDEHLGEDKSKIKINFQLGGEVVFYKNGYYSKVIKIDPDAPFSTLKVDLDKKEDVKEFKTSLLFDLKEINLNRIVTNMTKDEIKEDIEKYFISKNVNVGANSARFPNGNIDVKDAEHSMVINILDYRQVKSVYSNPKFMMATVDVQYILKSEQTGKVDFIETIKGVYLANFSSTKGLVPSKRMVQMMEQAIKTTQDKLMKNKDFLSAFD